MRKRLLTISILFFGFYAGAQSLNWYESTALILPEKRIEKGFFEPVRYGLNKNTELSTFGLGNILNPNLSLKHQWKKNNTLFISSKHRIAYPTPLLKTISSGGIGSLLPSTTIVPHFISLSNQLFITSKLQEYLFFTTKLEISFAPSLGTKKMGTIDYPVLYNRTSVFNNGILYKAGVNISRQLVGKTGFQIDLTAFLLNQPTSNLVWEQKGIFSWKMKAERRILHVGYLMTYGSYPFGKDFSVYPIIDVVWGRDRKNAEPNH